LIVDFEGSFCRGCETYDYFKELIYGSSKRVLDADMKILSFKNHEPETIRAKYSLEVADRTA